MIIIATILFAFACVDLLAAANELCRSCIKFKYMVRYKEFYIILIQLLRDVLLMIFLWLVKL